MGLLVPDWGSKVRSLYLGIRRRSCHQYIAGALSSASDTKQHRSPYWRGWIRHTGFSSIAFLESSPITQVVSFELGESPYVNSARVHRRPLSQSAPSSQRRLNRNTFPSTR